MDAESKLRKLAITQKEELKMPPFLFLLEVFSAETLLVANASLTVDEVDLDVGTTPC